MKKSFKKKILIDLDGVLNEYGHEPFNENFIPKIKEGAKEFLEELYKSADLYLFTTRNLLISAKWLINNKIDSYCQDITNIKIPSFLHIDDRCICFRGKYEDTLKEIEKFKVHWGE